MSNLRVDYLVHDSDFQDIYLLTFDQTLSSRI